MTVILFHFDDDVTWLDFLTTFASIVLSDVRDNRSCLPVSSNCSSTILTNASLWVLSNSYTCCLIECTPAAAVTCDADVEVCFAGAVGYICVPGKRVFVV